MPRKTRAVTAKKVTKGSPTWAEQYARAVAELVDREGLLPAQARKSRKHAKVAKPKKKRSR